MRILHVCSDFARQELYTRLVGALESCGVERQFVYVPVRTADELSAADGVQFVNTRIHLSHILKPRHRFLFRTKIRRVLADINSRTDVADFDVIHAHFLFSDGAAALRLNQNEGIPYVVAVRNTDLNAFWRLRPDLRGIARRVLKGASSVVFTSPAYREQLLSLLPKNLRYDVDAKARTVPNGIDNVWLSGESGRRGSRSETLRLLYVGDFSRNKNVNGVLRAAGLIAATRDVALTLVGGGGDGHDDLIGALEAGAYPFAKYAGRIHDKAELRKVYASHDVFVMPSFLETFGVAYIEALSQGMPILHSRGQGVDGYFEEGTVAEAVNPGDPQDIAEKILRLESRLPEIGDACRQQARRFGWSNIASEYLTIYSAAEQPE